MLLALLWELWFFVTACITWMILAGEKPELLSNPKNPYNNN
jgi:hypothetical protein